MSEVVHLIELSNNERMAVAGCGCKANRETYGGKEVILVKACAAPPAVWSRERPTEEGYYWWRGPVYGRIRSKLVEVCKDKTGLYVPAWNYVEFMEGEWSSSPLRPPVEEKR